MSRFEDLTGQKFGKLTVLSRERRGKGTRPDRFDWRVLCECGTAKLVPAGNLKSGQALSCGCDKLRLQSIAQTKHGQIHTRLYGIWTEMRRRCRTSTTTHHANGYATRGITVYEPWHEFEKFREDLEESYKRHVKEHGEKNTTIERKNVNGNYEPGNVEWATWEKQARNKRNSLSITYNGETMSLTAWAEKTAIPYVTLYSRLKKCWPLSRVFASPKSLAPKL